jgi:RNA polymerase sigma-70 factor (ECF subfamily)
VDRELGIRNREPGNERTASSPLERLYDALGDQLYRFFYHQVGNREEAEDLTSEVFLKASRLLDGSRDEASQRAWLRQAARTALADHWRRFYRGPTTPLAGDPAPRALADGTAEPQRTVRLPELLARLPENYRRVLELRFLEGCSVRETAAALGLSPGNVKVLQYRAVQRAAELGLAPEGGMGGADEPPI